MLIQNFPNLPLYVENAYFNGSWKYYTKKPHTHGFLECCFVAEGECRFEIGGKLYPLAANNLILLDSSLPHKISSDDKSPCTVLGFSLAADTLPGNAAFPTLMQMLNASLDICRMLLSLNQALVFPDASSLYGDMLCLFHEYEGRRDSFYLTSLSYRLLCCLARLPLTEKSAVPYYVEKAENYIRESFHRIKNNGQIASHIGLNATYLERIYKRTTGSSLWETVTACRLDAAKELLANSDIPVNEIDKRVGFANRQAFFLQFKKRFGMSPSGYRKQALS